MSVDVSEMHARAMARLLRLRGYEVVTAASGDEAIQLVEDGLIPDLILGCSAGGREMLALRRMLDTRQMKIRRRRLRLVKLLF